jgi:hypothetical protein
MINKGLFQRLVLATVLALGFLAVWAIVGIVVVEDGAMIALRDAVTDTLTIRADGTALIAHHEKGVVSHRDLNGAAVVLPEDDPIGPFGGVPLLPSLPWRKEDGDWDQRACFFTDGRTPHTAWYFLTDGRPEGKAYFAGYDSYHKTRIGYLGTAGFRAEPPPPEECFLFAGATSGSRKRVFCPGQDGRPLGVSVHRGVYSAGPNPANPGIVYVLGLDRTIYEADLRNRTVRIAARQETLRSLTGIGDIADPIHVNWLLAVRTATDVLVVDKHGKEQRRYPIPEELREVPFTFGETPAGEAVMYWNNEHGLMDAENLYRVFWVRPDGRSRTAAVALPNRLVPGLRVIVASLLPSPVALGVAGVMRSRELQEEGLTPAFSSALIRTATEFWPSAATVQLLSAGLAVLCYRRQKRYGLGRGECIAWPLFVLLLGLPGWIGYRFGRKWPALESCPDCGVAVPRDRESCVRCANEFSSPALRGTEVFAG